ncbi:MAG: hypothetical protein RR735_04260 [Bacteroidales bacterium]
MRIHYILLLIFLEITISLSADNTNRERDSILARINSIENDSTRLNYEASQLYKYIRTPHARIFVDKLYDDARKLGNKEKEMIALCGYYDIAYTVSDIEVIKKELKRVEEYAYKNNLHNYFFRCKRSYLSLMASNGNIEWVVDEAGKMKKEAAKLNNKVGVISAQISLAQAYKFARNNSKVIETLQEVLKLDGVDKKEKISIYLDLYNSFNNLNLYKDGLKYLDLLHELLYNIMKNDANSVTSLEARLMHTENLYANTYMKLGNYNKAAEHLRQSEKYYSPTCSIAYFVLYHSTHASYYAYTKKWDLCFKEINTAIERLKHKQPMLKQTMLSLKSKYLEQAGKLNEAVLTHRKLLEETDSLNTAFIQKQEETLAENYRWESGRIKNAQNSYILSLISTIFIILLLIIALGFISKLYWTYIQLQKAKTEAEDAERVAVESNRFKNALLKNISNEIDLPINRIKRAIEQTTSCSLAPDIPLIQRIEKETLDLIKLVDLVVEFSKLEVGAVKFNLSQENIVSICYKAIKLVNETSGSQAEICITSQVESQLILIDCERMLSCLYTAMTIPNDSKVQYKINFTVNYDNNGQSVVMELIGSPLSDISFDCQIQATQNHINNLFIKSFNGTYQLQMSKLRPILTISLPCKL